MEDIRRLNSNKPMIKQYDEAQARALALPAGLARWRSSGEHAQLTCERCTDVDVDLIYQQVVRTRGNRMTLADMMVGLAMVAKRLYPAERSQSAAFHKLLSDSLLPWMLQLQHALASGTGQ